MIKIGSCTVLYNPDSSVISNIETYSSLFDVCVVVDNSDSNNEFSKYFEDNPSLYIFQCMVTKELRLPLMQVLNI